MRLNSLASLTEETVTAGFISAVVYFICHLAGDDVITMVIIAGIAGHLGTRGIYRLENLIMRVNAVSSKCGQLDRRNMNRRA